MKRRLTCFAMFLPLLACLMAADTVGLPGGELAASSIDFDAGQPEGNPGNKANALGGKGPYVVGDNETFENIKMYAFVEKTGFVAAIPATKDATKWNAELPLVPGTYDVMARLTTKKANNEMTVDTKLVLGVEVKAK